MEYAAAGRRRTGRGNVVADMTGTQDRVRLGNPGRRAAPSRAFHRPGAPALHGRHFGVGVALPGTDAGRWRRVRPDPATRQAPGRRIGARRRRRPLHHDAQAAFPLPRWKWERSLRSVRAFRFGQVSRLRCRPVRPVRPVAGSLRRGRPAGVSCCRPGDVPQGPTASVIVPSSAGRCRVRVTAISEGTPRWTRRPCGPRRCPGRGARRTVPPPGRALPRRAAPAHSAANCGRGRPGAAPGRGSPPCHRPSRRHR